MGLSLFEPNSLAQKRRLQKLPLPSPALYVSSPDGALSMSMSSSHVSHVPVSNPSAPTFGIHSPASLTSFVPSWVTYSASLPSMCTHSWPGWQQIQITRGSAARSVASGHPTFVGSSPLSSQQRKWPLVLPWAQHLLTCDMCRKTSSFRAILGGVKVEVGHLDERELDWIILFVE